MTNYQPSDTYKLLWDQILEELLINICNHNQNYCIRYEDVEIHIEIGRKFEKYRAKAEGQMVGGRLDRHKLAACLCGAILESRPLTGYQGRKINKKANEIFAIVSGLNVLKCYMLMDLIKPLQLPADQEQKLKIYLKEHFDMDFPPLSDNIRDNRSYRENMENALYRCRQYCQRTEEVCYQFDIWAYSKIFYHLEVFNRPRLRSLYDNYTGKNKSAAM